MLASTARMALGRPQGTASSLWSFKHIGPREVDPQGGRPPGVEAHPQEVVPLGLSCPLGVVSPCAPPVHQFSDKKGRRGAKFTRISPQNGPRDRPPTARDTRTGLLGDGRSTYPKKALVPVSPGPGPHVPLPWSQGILPASSPWKTSRDCDYRYLWVC